MGAGWWGPAFLMDSGAMSSDELTSQVRVSRLREETRLAQVDAACKGQSQVFILLPPLLEPQPPAVGGTISASQGRVQRGAKLGKKALGQQCPKCPCAGQETGLGR